MANRSDFNSATLPRQIKRMLAGQVFTDAHQYGETIRLWVDAHKAHRAGRNRRLAARDNVNRSTEAATE